MGQSCRVLVTSPGPASQDTEHSGHHLSPTHRGSAGGICGSPLSLAVPLSQLHVLPGPTSPSAAHRQLGTTMERQLGGSQPRAGCLHPGAHRSAAPRLLCSLSRSELVASASIHCHLNLGHCLGEHGAAGAAGGLPACSLPGDAAPRAPPLSLPRTPHAARQPPRAQAASSLPGRKQRFLWPLLAPSLPAPEEAAADPRLTVPRVGSQLSAQRSPW